MTSWMAKLAAHYAGMRGKYPQDKLMIVFDIDATILDLRYMMLHVLQHYDRQHGTDYFRELRITDIDVHEAVLPVLLERYPLPAQAASEIEAWYKAHYWSSETIEASHAAYAGVLEIIRWFQMQPQTYVGLNTGRYEILRKDTLLSLNRLGQLHGLHFTDELLIMRPDDWTEKLSVRKVQGIQHFQAQGYRIFAFVDNEPANLAAVAQAMPGDELLLHPDTIYLSARDELPSQSVQGIAYELIDFISEETLPVDLELVWHGVNDRINLRQFLSSPVTWAEFDVNVDPTCDQLILRHDTFAERPPAPGEIQLALEPALAQVRRWEKAIKFDFKVGEPWIAQTLALVEPFEFNQAQLWFNADVEFFNQTLVRQLAQAYPGAIIQIPISFLGTLLDQPDALHRQIESYTEWGINRFSVNWQQAEGRRLFAHLREWGYAVNLYGLADLKDFLQAALAGPRSVTCDFNFPEWGYYGRGSGHNGHYHTYALQTDS